MEYKPNSFEAVRFMAGVSTYICLRLIVSRNDGIVYVYCENMMSVMTFSYHVSVTLGLSISSLPPHPTISTFVFFSRQLISFSIPPLLSPSLPLSLSSLSLPLSLSLSLPTHLPLRYSRSCRSSCERTRVECTTLRLFTSAR